MSDKLRRSLARFAADNSVVDKGKLSVVVILSRIWRDVELPISREDIETAGGGQVKGLGGQRLAQILSEHGITRRLASEAGRTSRGSLDFARRYADYLNGLSESGIVLTPELFEAIEAWWIKRVREYFNREGFPIQIDSSLTISAIVSEILEKSSERQRELRGATIRGTVLEHLVGAKLSLALGEEEIVHKTVSTADDSSGVDGDFEIRESVIHVTTAPSEALIGRCEANIRNGKRPVIVCPVDSRSYAASLAKNVNLSNRIEVFSAEEFISMNLNELSSFSSAQLAEKTTEFIDRYNQLIDEFETDPSLRIEHSRR